MERQLPLLQCGSCEPLKAFVHGTALGLAALMGLYNAAAWLSRRERHLGLNAVLYSALTLWEIEHVAHHIEAQRRLSRQTDASVPDGAPDLGRLAA
jgi:hypothetical protein